MTLEVYFPEHKEINERVVKEFLQDFANRWYQGHCRYGKPNPLKKYMKRLELEFKAYKKTGNTENLRNVMVYAGLEIVAPQHPKSHYDPFAKSATRGRYVIDSKIEKKGKRK